MSMVMPSVTETRAILSELLGEISKLIDELTAQPGAQGRLYRLPVMTFAHRSEYIDVTPVVGPEALGVALSAYGQVYREDNQDPVTSVRYPGVIFCDALPMVRVERINALKDQLSALVSSLKGRPRSTFMRQALPNISAHHLCRHIPVLSPALTVSSVSFTWAGNTSLMRALSYDEAVAFCARRSATGDIHPRDLEILNQSSGQIYERRLMAPHPRMNIVTLDAQRTRPRPLMMPANLPLLIQSPGSRVAVSPLMDYEEGADRQPRSDRKPLRPLIPQFDLYEEIAAHD